MATVYLAQDLRHDRRVAVKVLRPELAAIIGAERFLAEIKTTANLQHPHILPLHDSGEADSYLYYVMPFVEGESLRARLLREKQLPVADAVTTATEVASALDYAHRHGVIHRDIKPENILLHDGRALVADFGIALAVSRAGSTRMTETGMSLGTPHYMSPEQATGERDITPRSDVYALGAVVYEMLTGEPPFTGPTAQAIVAKVLTDQPAPIRAHRHTVPVAVESAVLMALEKLPADRFAGAADFARALISEQPVVTRRAAARGPGSRPPHGVLAQPRLRWAGAALLGAVALAAAWFRPRGAPAERPPVVRFGVDLPKPYGLSTSSPAPVFSPDGRSVVIPGMRSNLRYLFLLRLADGRPTLIPGTADARPPAFSPDGRWLAFCAGGKLLKVALDGGSPIALADADGLGVAWLDDQTIIYNRKYNTGLWRVSASGGTPDSISSPRDGELGHWWPQVLPGRRPTVLFTAYGGAIEQARIAVVDPVSGRRTDIVTGGAYGRYLPSGRLAYFRAGNIFAVPFDLATLAVTGAPLPILQHVAADRLTAMPYFATSASGHLAWVPDSQYLPLRELRWLDLAGQDTPAVAEAGSFNYPRLSPDGRRVALTIEGDGPDLWVMDLATGARTRLTRSPVIDQAPIWTPDGRAVIYQSENKAFDIYARAADASDTAVLLYTTRFDKYPYSLTPDGRVLMLMEDSLAERILVVPLDDTSKARTYAAGPYNQESPTLSRDGRWLAFASDESGRWQVYVSRFDTAAASPRTQPVPGATMAPSADYMWIQWSGSGRELFYTVGDSLMRVPFDPAQGLPGRPGLVLRTPGEIADVSADGRRVLILRTPPETTPRRVQVVLNWMSEVEAGAGR